MDELKELYIAPEARILCFQPIERLAAWGDGIVEGEDVGVPAGPSGGEDAEDDQINGE